MFVKFELLRAGKPPRNIFNPSTLDVVAMRVATKPLEQEMLLTEMTFKGVQTQDKWQPIVRAARAVDPQLDVWVVCLDDTARDGNCVEHDQTLFIGILYSYGLLSGYVLSIVSRVFATTTTRFFKLGLYVFSLLSGVPHTSVMNYWVSVFGLWCWATCYLGLRYHQFAIVAEGDDTALIIKAAAARACAARGLFTEQSIGDFGLRLRKRWKLEDCGPLDKARGHPIVGGVVIESYGQFYFFPSFKRFLLKAGWCADYGLANVKAYRRRASARACALVDRYSGVPVMWAYAARVALAFGLQTKGMTEEERFSYSGNTRCHEPSMAVRLAFEKAYGITISDQITLERILRLCDLFEDLTVHEDWCRLTAHI